ncbi:glutathione S-transferase theta-1-like [Lissotriton helveticus]
MLQLYLDLMSQPCRAVFIFAKANNIDFEFKLVDLFKGENNSEEFQEVNSLRKVPALKDGDFTLAESIAILLYLSRKFDTPDHWYPADLEKRTRVDEYFAWQHTAVRAYSSEVFWCKVLTPILLDTEMDSERMEVVLKQLNMILDQFQQKFLKDKPFIIGDEISLADVVAVVDLMEPFALGFDIFQDRPLLEAWRGRVEEALGSELFQEAHKNVMNFLTKPREPINPPTAAALKAKLSYLYK